MVDWLPIVPIFVAIIGVAGVFLPPFVGKIIRPDINIEIYPENNNNIFNKTIVNLVNNGIVPATNLSLIVTLDKTNSIINSVTNELSTTNITLAIPGSPHSLLVINHPMPVKKPFLEIHVRKFVNGDGSEIKLAIDGKGTIYTDYTVYAVFDQGSEKMTGGQSSFLKFNYYYLLIIIGIITYISLLFSKYFKQHQQHPSKWVQ